MQMYADELSIQSVYNPKKSFSLSEIFVCN